MKRTSVLAVAAGAIAVALALALTGCGGSDDSDDVASLTDTTGQSRDDQGSGNSGDAERDREQAALDYARCMREHGVDMPDPVNGRFEFKNQRRDQRKFEEAQQACEHILRDAAPQVDEEQEAEMREATLRFARCMRQHGVDMPDPTFPEGGGILMRMPEGAEDDPNFDEAQKACQPILDAAQPDEPSAGGGSS